MHVLSYWPSQRAQVPAEKRWLGLLFAVTEPTTSAVAAIATRMGKRVMYRVLGFTIGLHF